MAKNGQNNSGLWLIRQCVNALLNWWWRRGGEYITPLMNSRNNISEQQGSQKYKCLSPGLWDGHILGLGTCPVFVSRSIEWSCTTHSLNTQERVNILWQDKSNYLSNLADWCKSFVTSCYVNCLVSKGNRVKTKTPSHKQRLIPFDIETDAFKMFWLFFLAVLRHFLA